MELDLGVFAHAESFVAPTDGTFFKGELMLSAREKESIKTHSMAQIILTSGYSPDDSTTVFVSNVGHHIQIWSPELKLSFPIDDGRQWSTDQKWTLAVSLEYRQEATPYLNYPTRDTRRREN